MIPFFATITIRSLNHDDEKIFTNSSFGDGWRIDDEKRSMNITSQTNGEIISMMNMVNPLSWKKSLNMSSFNIQELQN